jgi:hypothetical protein
MPHIMQKRCDNEGERVSPGRCELQTRGVHVFDLAAPPAQQEMTAMSDAQDQNPAAKDPEDWVTGDEPMTAAQASYLETLSREAGEEFDSSLTKAAASERIDELQARTGRGQGSGTGAAAS